MINAAFFIAVYRDQPLATSLIESLARVYPESRRLICSDGDRRLDFERFCVIHGCDYLDGERLKLSRFGGQWLVRMLNFYLSVCNADYLIKLDPDSRLIRPFSAIPEAQIFGRLASNGVKEYVQGGAIGIRRDAATEILQSELLLMPKYRRTEYSYRRYREPYLQEGETASNERLIAADVILSDVAECLNLQIADWAEIASFPTQQELIQLIEPLPAQEVARRFALLHPLKTYEHQSF